MEGYLASFMRDFSQIGGQEVVVSLHGSSSPIKRSDGMTEVASRLRIGNWPRLFATLNVDATSQPPARKVSARGLVLVIEPIELSDEQLLEASTLPGAPSPLSPHYQQALMNPSVHADYLRTQDEGLLKAVVADVHHVAGEISAVLSSTSVVSARTQVRMVQFAAAYILVAIAAGRTSESARALGIEYGILHSVLPALPEELFPKVLEAILQPNPRLTPVAVGAEGEHGSPLYRRASRAKEAGGTDFWLAFS